MSLLIRRITSKPRKTVSASLATTPSLRYSVSMRGAEWKKLGDIVRDKEFFFQGSEIILRIGTLRRSFCDAPGGSAPTSSLDTHRATLGLINI